MLPEGKRIDKQARLLLIDSYIPADPNARPESADPTFVLIKTRPGSLDTARAELMRAAGEFGLSRRDIEEWYAESKAAGSREGETGRVGTRLPRLSIGYMRVGVSGSYSPISDQAFVQYSLSWIPLPSSQRQSRSSRGSGRDGVPVETTAEVGER